MRIIDGFQLFCCVSTDNHTRVVPYFTRPKGGHTRLKIWYNPCMIIPVDIQQNSCSLVRVRYYAVFFMVFRIFWGQFLTDFAQKVPLYHRVFIYLPCKVCTVSIITDMVRYKPHSANYIRDMNYFCSIYR